MMRRIARKPMGGWVAQFAGLLEALLGRSEKEPVRLDMLPFVFLASNKESKPDPDEGPTHVPKPFAIDWIF